MGRGRRFEGHPGPVYSFLKKEPKTKNERTRTKLVQSAAQAKKGAIIKGRREKHSFKRRNGEGHKEGCSSRR